MNTIESRAFQFEIFMTRAYKLDKRIRRPSKGEFYTLIRVEEHGKKERELNVLKNRIEQAIEIFIKQNIEYQTKEKLQVLLSLNDQAKNSSDIASVILRALTITDQFK